MTEKKRPVVYVTLGIPPKSLERLSKDCDVRLWKGAAKIPKDEFVSAVRQIKPDALLVDPREPVDVEILEAAGPQLKVIGTFSVGLEHIDLDECKKRGVAVGYAPNVLTSTVAEHTMGLLLATARKYKPALDAVHKGVWGSKLDNSLWMCGKEIGGSIIGIVGLGRIGLSVAKRLKAFEPSRILYCGNSSKEGAVEVGAEFVSFETLLQQSDIVIATCSINSQNKGLFNSTSFKKMKKSAIFVNVTRGALVNQDDLYEALKHGEIAAAGLDVTTPEPLPADNALLKLENCIILPHLGTATHETRNKMGDLTVRNIVAGIRGEKLPAPVTFD